MEKLPKPEFDAVRSYEDFDEYENDHREIVHHEATSTTMVTPAEIVAAVRDVLTDDENGRFEDEQIATKAEYAGSNHFRTAVDKTAIMCRESAARQKASEEANEAEEAAREAEREAAEAEERA